MGIVEDRLQRRRPTDSSERSSGVEFWCTVIERPGVVGRIHPEELAVGDRRRQHDVGEQRVDNDHVLQRIPLFFGDSVQVEMPLSGKINRWCGPNASNTVQLLLAIVANVFLCTVAKW